LDILTKHLFNMLRISYAITACNEHEELERLLQAIQKYIRDEDEVVVLLDTNHTQEVWDVVTKWNVGTKFEFHRVKHSLNQDFAQFKNFLKSHCSREFIFFIDADEFPSELLLKNLPFILENNGIDMLLVPRVNTVEGITVGDIRRWGWRVDDDGHINWPDYQFRICRNLPEIMWEGRVHERLTGYKKLSQLPYDNKTYCLYHPKDIERQRKQNQFYDTI
jgi:glycosyltransferase involved in cell wall biosynthesis